MNNPMTQRLVDFGAVFTPAATEPGQEYWRLVMADGPMEWGGRHGIYLDALDKEGQRVIGVPVLFWNGGESPRVTEAKPGEPYALDLPMFAQGNAYSVRINDGKPSDQVTGMGLVAWERHVVFQLVFQLTVALGEPPSLPVIPQPPEPVDTHLPWIGTGNVREAIRMARTWLDEAERLLT